MFDRRRALAGLLALGLLTACGGPDGDDDVVTVGAAASLRRVLPELFAAYRAAHPDVRLEATYASSGTVRAQVEAGAPIDGVLLASDRHVDLLVERGRAHADSRAVFARNRLVLVAGADSPATGITALASLPARERVAIGAPDSVPAGRYARELLQSRGLWDGLQEHLVFARDVSAVVTYVRRGEAAAGFVYATDVRGIEGLRILETADGAEDPAPRVVGVAVTQAPRAAAFRAFLAWLGSERARALLASHGFAAP